MSEDLRKAEKIKQLYDEYLAKANPKSGLKARHHEAAQMMDKHVGTQWRLEIKMPNITIITAPGEEEEEKEDDQTFFDRLACAVDQEGLGPKDTEEPELSLKERLQRKLSDRSPR